MFENPWPVGKPVKDGGIPNPAKIAFKIGLYFSSPKNLATSVDVSLKSNSGPHIRSIDPPPTLFKSISASLPIAFSVGNILCSKDPNFQSRI